MKKILIALLAAASIAFSAVTVYADSGVLTDIEAGKDIDVNVNYNDGTESPDVYSVDIIWESMEFTYNAAGTKDWDATKHEYVDNTTGQWDKDTANITVTNHSNLGIDVKVSYTATDESGVVGEIVNGEFTIDSAVGKATDAAELSKTASLKISGEPSDKTATNLKVGTVTVEFLPQA